MENARLNIILPAKKAAEKEKTIHSKRYDLIDSFRGFSVLSMIFYHMVWDLFFLFDLYLPWFNSDIGFAWQQSICISFIAISGFCSKLGKRRISRAIKVLLAGAVISAATLAIMPNERILFGILTLIGSCMLLIILLEKLLCRINPYTGAVISVLLFVITRNVGRGFIFGFDLPRMLYRNIFTTYVGFTSPNFYSSDYFPLIPWIFIFTAGYFIYDIAARSGRLTNLLYLRIPPLDSIGRHALLIYLLHQPVIMLILTVIIK